MVFVIDRTEYPPSCLPEHIDKLRLLDVTTIGDSWKRYLDPEIGKIHDCKGYFEMYKQTLKDE